jgi:ketosteroid isomerase-like protein
VEPSTLGAALTDLNLGSEAANRIDDATDPGRAGSVAALETFYYALNQADANVLAEVWSGDPLAQLNNPLGGILRGGRAIVDLYKRVFAGPARLQVEFDDVVEYLGERHALFAGREHATYAVGDGPPTAVEIRTSRYFRYQADDGRWLQFHHHGSIDDPVALAAYQQALLG